MTNIDNLLVELGTEELPPKPLKKLSDNFAALVRQGLTQAGLSFVDIIPYAAPRRLALKITGLNNKQPDRYVEKRGPALTAAFDTQGNLTKACEGFLRSAGATADQIIKRDNYVWINSHELGKSVADLIPGILTQAIAQLPIPKRMRWGNYTAEFVRPVHWIVLLYGNQIIPATLLDHPAGRNTFGHRFHHPQAIALNHADDYEAALEAAYVIPCFEKRREQIRSQIIALAREKGGQALINDDLLDEVTALVEWPVALCGQFNERFLQVPAEALISAMEGHQKSFAIVDQHHHLKPYFITISNIESNDTQRVIQGNQRVMHARLSDAEFFYQTDLKSPLSSYVEPLKNVVFQTQLGTVYDKTLRISTLAVLIAEQIGIDKIATQRTAVLCKADLMTSMVGEFPELQGIAGYYYAKQANEPAETALAIKEHYLPRFAGDELPTTMTGCAVALADRIDTLVGIFGINQIPTGEKDPFGLRRAALGILRIIIEHNLTLDLLSLIQYAFSQYKHLPNQNTVNDVFDFIMERMRGWYSERGLPADIFQAVMANKPTKPLDFHHRVNAVSYFLTLPEAAALAAANKRVSRILQKEALNNTTHAINPTLLTDDAEKILAEKIIALATVVNPLYQQGNYNEVLTTLAQLREPIDQFFDHVMVMVDDAAMRQNRIALLQQLRALFLLVADISLLQG
jgi:glycyl-tRNA synthetase beta chain